MATETRYIVFAGDEIRKAIAGFVAQQSRTVPDQITGMEIIGDKEAPCVVVRSSDKSIKVAASDLVGILLLYCRQQDIPIAQRSRKNVERSPGGLMLVLTTDRIEGGVPVVSNDRISYQDTSVMDELRLTKQELARATARLEQAERMIAQAYARADAAEKAAVDFEKAANKLVTIARAPGLRGMIGRKLIT
jgi:hypothetical protein